MLLKSKVFFYFIIIQKNLDKSLYSGIIIKPHIMGSKKYVYVFAYRSETYEGEKYYVRSYRNRW